MNVKELKRFAKRIGKDERSIAKKADDKIKGFIDQF